MGDVLLNPTVLVAIIAAIAAIVSSALNINAMRKPRPGVTADAADLTDSATGLVARLEIRLDKLEERYCRLEEKYDELEEDYQALETAFRECLDGSLRNISHMKQHEIVPVYEPELPLIKERKVKRG